MGFQMFLFESDYLKENILTLENCVLLASKLPCAYPRVFFTRDISKDTECEIMVVEVLKKDTLNFKKQNKKAKTLIVTTTPLASFEHFVFSGMKSSYLLMDKENVLDASDDTQVNESIETPSKLFGRPNDSHSCIPLSSHTSHRDIRLFEPNNILVGPLGLVQYDQHSMSLENDQSNCKNHSKVSFLDSETCQIDGKCKDRSQSIKKNFDRKRMISSSSLAILREDFLALRHDRHVDFLPSSPPPVHNYGKLQIRYNLKRALMKILDSKKFSNRRQKEHLARHAASLPCSHRANLATHHKSRSPKHPSRYDEASNDSNESGIQSFILSTSENNYKIFNNDDGIVHVRHVVSNLKKRIKRSINNFSQHKIKINELIRLFKDQEFIDESSDSDFFLIQDLD